MSQLNRFLSIGVLALGLGGASPLLAADCAPGSLDTAQLGQRTDQAVFKATVDPVPLFAAQATKRTASSDTEAGTSIVDKPALTELVSLAAEGNLVDFTNNALTVS